MANIYGNSEIWGNLLVTGSFSILGSASTIYSSSLVVSDTIISLGHSQSGSPILDEGIMFTRGTGLTQAIIWDESDDTFALIGTNDDHTLIGDINIDSYSNLRTAGITTSNLKITDGAVSGYFLQSDSSGLSTWSQITAANISGLPGGLTGSGTTNFLSKWSSAYTLTDSLLRDNGTVLGINTINTSNTLTITSATQASMLGLYNTSAIQNYKTGADISVTGTGSVIDSRGIQITVSGASTNNYGSFVQVTGTNGSANFGYYSSNISTSNTKYGSYNQVLGDNLSSINYGSYNYVTGASTQNWGFHSYVTGTYSSQKVGYSTEVLGTNGTNTINYGGMFIVKDGFKNVALSLGFGNVVSPGIFDAGILNYVQPTYVSQQPIMYGEYIENSGTAQTKIGLRSYLSGNGKSDNNYGLWSEISGANSTNYGLYNIVSGTGSLNYGIYLNSYGATLNYGVYVENGTSIFNASQGNYDFTIRGTIDPNLFTIDASDNSIGIGLSPDQYTKLQLSTTNTAQFTAAQFSNNTYSGPFAYALRGTAQSTTSNYNIGIEGSAGNGTIENWGVRGIAGGTNTINKSILGEASASNSSDNIAGYFAASNTGSGSAYAIVGQSGNVVFNEIGGNWDFRVEGDTDQNLLFVDASTDNIGIGTSTPIYKLQVSGTVSTTGFRMTSGASNGYVLTSDANGVASWQPASGGTSSGITGTGTANYVPRWSSSTQLTNSSIYDNGTTICFGQTTSTVDTLLFVKETTSSVRTGIYSEVSGSAPNIGMASHVGSSVGPGSGDFAILGNIGSSTASDSFSFYGRNVGSSTFNSHVYFAENQSTTPNKYLFFGTLSGAGLSSNNVGQRLSVSGATLNNYGHQTIVSGSASFNYGHQYTVSQGSTNTGILLTVSGGTDAYGTNVSVSSATNNSFGNYIQVSGTQSNQRKVGTYIVITDSNSSSTHNIGVVSFPNNGFRNTGGYFVVGSGFSLPSSDIALHARVSSVLSSSQSITHGIYVTNEDDRSLTKSYGIESTVSSNATTNYGLYVDVYNGTTNNGVVVRRGTSTFNELGDTNTDFKISGSTVNNLFYVDASADNIGVGTNTPSYRLQVSGTVSSTTGFNTNGVNGWTGTFSAGVQVVTVSGGIITNVV